MYAYGVDIDDDAMMATLMLIRIRTWNDDAHDDIDAITIIVTVNIVSAEVDVVVIAVLTVVMRATSNINRQC